jgi:N-acetyl-gamma-glutamyl-phosphate reductase common form
MSTPLQVAVVGATGYAGAELVRILLRHPSVQLTTVVSRSRTGERLDAVHPGLQGLSDLLFTAPDPNDLARHDAVFLAVPHGTAQAWAERLDALNCPRIFDLSSDHRHGDGWVYGQAEWNAASLAGATRVAVPGCFATAISLALAPFVATRSLHGSVQCVAATGSTGSGATPKRGTHHPERFVNLKAYKVLTHQHTPEVETFLSTLGTFERLHFVPLSAPLDRGILATVFFELADAQMDPLAELETAYADHPLIRIRSESPELRHVRGTGFCDLHVTRDGAQVTVLSAIDNLGKGAAAQAVQCLNLSIGLPTTTGLALAPCLP